MRRDPHGPRGGSGVLLGGVLLAALLAVTPLLAFESYHDPNTQGQGYCADCHDGFVGRGPLHTLQVGSGAFTTDCSACHTGSGRDNPLTMWSQDDDLGCMGCHGRDYGETILENYRSFATAGKAKASGYGLRKHHTTNGITFCIDCHGDVDPSFI